MASIISAGTTSGTALNMTADTSGQLQLATGASATTAVTIDTSQNVGIGTTSPANKLEVKGSTAGTSIQVTSSATTSSYPGIIVKSGTQSVYTMSQSADDGTAYLYNQASASLAFGTNNIERMRIDSSGNLLLNSTSNTTFSGASGSPKQYIYGGSLGSTLNNTVDTLTLVNTNANTNYLRFYQFRNTAGTDWTTATTRISQITDSTLQSYIDFNPVNGTYGMAFGTGNSTVERMRIDSNGYALIGYTSSNGAYKLQVNSQIFATSSTIATSDARYKTNIEPITSAIELVNKLNPVSFDWKKHPIHEFPEGKTIGFLAQEVQEVLKDTDYVDNIVKTNECVISPEEKDEDGNVTKEAVKEEFLGIAEGNLIPLLTKAIQEQQTIINDLKARITALEGAK